MKARGALLPYLSFLSLAVGVVPAFGVGQMKLCGTVQMPPGQSFTSGELTLKTTVESFTGGTPSSAEVTTPLDPSTRRFCIEQDGAPADSLHFRASVALASAPAQELFTGNFTTWDATA